MSDYRFAESEGDMQILQGGRMTADGGSMKHKKAPGHKPSAL